MFSFFFFQAEDGIRDLTVTGVQTCALPICRTAVSSFPVRRRLSILATTALAHGTVVSKEKTVAAVYDRRRCLGTAGLSALIERRYSGTIVRFCRLLEERCGRCLIFE